MIARVGTRAPLHPDRHREWSRFAQGFHRHATLAMLAAALLACSDRGTVAGPDLARTRGRASDETPVPPPTIRGAIVRRTLPLTQDYVVTTTITPAGGWLAIDEAGLVLVFPQGAVSSDLVVTATAYAGNRVVYDFQPHGTQFNKPIYVAQELRDTELDTQREQKRADLYGGYLANGLDDITPDGLGDFSQVFPGAYEGHGTSAYGYFATTHFSGYAMASGKTSPGNSKTR